MNLPLTSIHPPGKGGINKDHLINRTRVSKKYRRAQGARRRVNRLQTELLELQAILRRRFIESPLENGAKEIIRLRPFEVDAYRNKRTETEHELTLARRDFMINEREYREAINHNFNVNRNKVTVARKENRIRRQSKALLKKTLEIINHQSGNGGSEKVKELTDLAKSGDVKSFRKIFDKYAPDFDQEHYFTVSGVENVKTEILHDVMAVLASPDSSFPNLFVQKMEIPTK